MDCCLCGGGSTCLRTSRSNSAPASQFPTPHQECGTINLENGRRGVRDWIFVSTPQFLLSLLIVVFRLLPTCPSCCICFVIFPFYFLFISVSFFFFLNFKLAFVNFFCGNSVSHFLYVVFTLFFY
jgi:hypothetical protein